MRVVKVKESGNETASYTYDANGNKKSETLANGVVSTYTYNKANRITKLENKSGNVTMSSYEYSYYLDGSDACKIRSESGIIETTSYEYDGLKRLTEEAVKVGNNLTDTYSYEYDDYGNRSKMTAEGTEDYVTEYSYVDSNGKYTALLQKEVKTVENEADENLINLNPASNVKQTVYTYDANGNQITKTAEGKTETNTYDGLNQLIGFNDGETTASYKYNASGLRYEKTVDGETINHVWDGSKQIVADVVDNQFYEADCYIRGTNLVAKYNYWNGNKSEYTYYTQNAHGDVVNLTDSTGAVTKKYTYDAFGVEKNIDKNDTNAFRYCGEYFDKETATVYLRARYYNPSTGRFTQRDSLAGNITDPLSLNLYTYCANNPVFFCDPSGHFVVEAALATTAAAAMTWLAASAIESSRSKTQSSTSNKIVNAFSIAAITIISPIKPILTYGAKAPENTLPDGIASNFYTTSAAEQTWSRWGYNPTSFKLKNYTKLITKAITSSISQIVSKTISQKKANNQNVYLLFDEKTDQIEYVGRTNNLVDRKLSHKNSSNRNHLTMIPIAKNISYGAARGLEQWAIEYYNTYNPVRFGGNAYNNQINGISSINPLRAIFFADAVPYASKLPEIMKKNGLKRRSD